MFNVVIYRIFQPFQPARSIHSRNNFYFDIQIFRIEWSHPQECAYFHLHRTNPSTRSHVLRSLDVFQTLQDVQRKLKFCQKQFNIQTIESKVQEKHHKFNRANHVVRGKYIVESCYNFLQNQRNKARQTFFLTIFGSYIWLFGQCCTIYWFPRP